MIVRPLDRQRLDDAGEDEGRIRMTERPQVRLGLIEQPLDGVVVIGHLAR